MSERTFLISRDLRIARPADVVRAQFADMEHHRRNRVHRGITLEILSRENGRCRVRQEFRLAGLKQREVLEIRTTGGMVTYDYLEGSWRR